MDATPEPETLQTIADSIAALRKSMDQRFDEMNAHLGAKIDALDANITLLLDTVLSFRHGR